MQKNYILYEHEDSSITTLSAFLNDPNSIAKGFAKKEKEFLAIKGTDGRTNKQQIQFLYSKDEVKKYPNCDLLKVGTILFIPNAEINKEIQAIMGKDLFLKQRDFSLFENEEYKKLLADPTFVKSKIDLIHSLSDKTYIEYLELSCQVWIYSRVLDKIIDVTAYIASLNTSVTLDGGTFSFTLSMKNEEIVKFFTNTSIIEYFSVNDNTFGDFFTKVLQQNDIVFIRFEKMENEKARKSPLNKMNIPESKLPNQIYDMIGLIDDVSNPIMTSSFNMTTRVRGRDFSKLLLDDGSYFYPYALVKGGAGFFVNSGSDNRFIKRLFVNAKYNILFAYTFRTISNTLGFIFTQLSNVGVLPEDSKLFSAYKTAGKDGSDKTSKVLSADGLNKWIPAHGVWQIVKTIVDKKLDHRRIANADITKPDGTLMEQAQKVCQKPFVEFWGDTYGDEYVFTARQPPFNKQAVIDALKSESLITITGASSINLSWETAYYSFYQLTAQNALMGSSNYIAMAHVPVIYFPDYINNFGNKKLETPLNYLPSQAFDGDKTRVDANVFRENIANDFVFIIEINSYRPFTRRGTITIQGGDRRIKRGMWVKLEDTNELCFVDAVQHSLMANGSQLVRNTVLTVSRCMITDYIEGKVFSNETNRKAGRTYKGAQQIYKDPISYFNIVKTDVIKNALISKNTDYSSTSTPFLINADVFDFFLKRKQIL